MKLRLKRLASAAAALCFLLGASLNGYCPTAAATGSSSDTLTIKVGYFGLPSVTKQVYTKADLTSFELHSALYTMNSNGAFLSYADAEGYYLSDILTDSGINLSALNYVNFLASDGHYATKNYYYKDLFGTKYAFPDLSLYYGIYEGVVDEHAVWATATTVQTMVAIRDNFSRVGDFSEYVPGEMAASRGFRLMLGQDYPGQKVAADSIHSLNTIVVTYAGSPSINTSSNLEISVGEDMQLDVTIGSADADFSAMIAAGLKYESSDPSVVKVDSNGKLTPVGKGEAQITIYYANSNLTTTVTVVVGGEENSSGSGSTQAPQASDSGSQGGTAQLQPSAAPDVTSRPTTSSRPETTPDPEATETPDPEPSQQVTVTPEPDATPAPSDEQDPEDVYVGTDPTVGEKPTLTVRPIKLPLSTEVDPPDDTQKDPSDTQPDDPVAIGIELVSDSVLYIAAIAAAFCLLAGGAGMFVKYKKEF